MGWAGYTFLLGADTNLIPRDLRRQGTIVYNPRLLAVCEAKALDGTTSGMARFAIITYPR
jgi:hypothetical protein